MESLELQRVPVLSVIGGGREVEVSRPHKLTVVKRCSTESNLVFRQSAARFAGSSEVQIAQNFLRAQDMGCALALASRFEHAGPVFCPR